MSPRELACLVLALLAACHAVEPSSRTRWVVPPLFDPHSFRIESVLFDVPKELAGEFGPTPSENDALIGFRIDETGRREALEARAKSDARIVRALRPDIVVRSKERAPIPPRAGESLAPLESDRLSLVAGASVGSSWAPADFALAATWSDANGQRIAGVDGVTPLPANHWIQSFHLPPSNGAAPTAVIGFFHVVPIFDECSEVRTLDPGDGLASEAGRLINVGKVPVHYCVAGDRVPHRVELGDAGEVRWEGDERELVVLVGAHAVFTCSGNANRVRVTASGGRITFVGARNACTNVADGNASRFESRPKRTGEWNAIDLGGESNELAGPWLDPVQRGG